MSEEEKELKEMFKAFEEFIEAGEHLEFDAQGQKYVFRVRKLISARLDYLDRQKSKAKRP